MHYTKKELLALGFKAVGNNCLISKKASFYGAERIALGNSVRIDDFCVLSAGEGGIELGNYIHIAVYSSLIGKGKMTLHDYVNISSRVSIYSSNDDYSGATMTNPMVDSEFTNVESAPVTLGKHVIVGSGSVILPNVTIAEGAAVAALSLVVNDVAPFSIVGGTPARFLKARETALLEKEQQFLKKLSLTQS